MADGRQAAGLHESGNIYVEEFPTVSISMAFLLCYVFLDLSSKNLSGVYLNL